LAYECGINPSVLSRLENGQRMANIYTLKKIAIGFNMEIGKLISEIEKKIPENIKIFDV